MRCCCSSPLLRPRPSPISRRPTSSPVGSSRWGPDVSRAASCPAIASTITTKAVSTRTALRPPTCDAASTREMRARARPLPSRRARRRLSPRCPRRCRPHSRRTCLRLRPGALATSAGAPTRSLVRGCVSASPCAVCRSGVRRDRRTTDDPCRIVATDDGRSMPAFSTLSRRACGLGYTPDGWSVRGSRRLSRQGQ